ncbi:MAG: DNA-processing protein DprA [Oscillospiraceae bacterium]|nr:DNA-processing protein DprA [Oscillospiraceae bacterium]
MTDSAIWIWYQLLLGIGTRRSHQILEYFPDPADILRGIEARGQVLSMLKEDELMAWQPALRTAEEIKRRTLSKGCEIITPDHPFYPPLLQNIHAKPAALYVKGDLTCLQGTLVIAMVGTRNFTEYGRDVGRKIAQELAACGAVVVSGLAKGIDTICHTAALKAGGKSIGILGCGIDVDYPSGSAQLKRNLVESGAVLTEYPLGTEALKANFPMRNRLISGMSDGTLVVEADMKSGSLLTAAHALQQSREVFAVPGSIFSVREQGTHKLLKEGAKLTESAHDILGEFAHRNYKGLCPERIPELTAYNPARDGKAQEVQTPAGSLDKTPEPKPERPAPKSLPEEIYGPAREVYALLGTQPKTVETIADECQFGLAKIQSALTQLEIYGLIKGYPGRRFSL